MIRATRIRHEFKLENVHGYALLIARQWKSSECINFWLALILLQVLDF
jgi:hypothetical protein